MVLWLCYVNYYNIIGYLWETVEYFLALIKMHAPNQSEIFDGLM